VALSIGQGLLEVVWCWGMWSLINISGRGVQGCLGSGETASPDSTHTGRSIICLGLGHWLFLIWILYFGEEESEAVDEEERVYF